jgi:pimeloyl-ACP methyl ester carboxylesterase
MRRVVGLASLAALLMVGCSRSGVAPTAATSSGSTSEASGVGRADIGGYSLAYQCQGVGRPTVILEAGYTASGVDTFGTTILPALARTTRVCTYDRAGDGTSDQRPADVRPLTGATQAHELAALLRVLHVDGPYVMVGHSYGGVVSREFAAAYPHEVAGMVLVDASSEPEIPVYDRLDAGPWVDGSRQPAGPNQTIDIHATVSELEAAPSLGAMPLVVITAGILEDQWLRTAPALEARAQTRLADLSTDSVHVLDQGVGHLVPTQDPALVIAAVRAVLDAVRSGRPLAACSAIVQGEASARCVTRGQLAHQTT